MTDYDALFRLDGRKALVVGGYGGIGVPTVRLLSAQGAAVAVAGRSLDKAKALAADLPNGAAVRIDVTDHASVDAGVAEAVSVLGGLDVLVNMAGTLTEGPASDMGDDVWRSVLASNLDGAFWLSQAAGRHMLEAGGGRIIHFSSVRSVSGGRRGFVAYAAAKAGLNNMVRQLATEWGPRGITVNAVAPGFVKTDIVESVQQDENFMRMVLMRIPMGRMAEPVEIAGAVGWLASPAASFVNGQVVFVDGGVTASQ